jgi:phosphatidylglycerophosphate synthase
MQAELVLALILAEFIISVARMLSSSRQSLEAVQRSGEQLLILLVVALLVAFVPYSFCKIIARITIMATAIAV